MLILPDGSSRSRQLLDEAIADRFRITMLVMGDGRGEDVVASKADIRAQAIASTRRVVWIRDPKLLNATERQAYLKGADTVACVLNLNDTPVAWLSRAQASDFTELELAFLKGQGAA